MAFPASADPAVLNALAAGAFASLSDEGCRDLVKKESPMFYILEKKGCERVGEWSHHYMVRVLDKDDSQPKSFTGLDTLSSGAVQAARAALFGFANYDINVTIPWEDEINLTGANALGDYVEEVTFKQLRSLGARMSQDMVRGNQSDSKNFLGLEQAVPTFGHDTTGTAFTAARWQFRQATNTYGGVARTAWTSATAGGTHWESLAADVTDLGASPETTFESATVGKSTELQKLFQRVCNALSYEASSPDCILSTWQPQEDANNAGFGLQRIAQDEKGAELDIAVNIMRYKGMDWYAAEQFGHSLVAPTGGATPTTANLLYILTMSSWKYLVHKRANWLRTPFLGLTTQAGAIGRIRHRGQLVCEDPGVNAVLYNYGVA